MRPDWFAKSGEGSAGAAGAIDVFGEERVGFVTFVADDVDQAAPAVAEADDLVALAKSTVSDAANCRIEAGDIAASGKNADDAFLVPPLAMCEPFWVTLNG